MSTLLKDYSYDFPEELIALYPAKERAGSKLMVLDRAAKSVAHENFSDITAYFQDGDVLVLNDSKVFPCRLVTKRASGGRQEILLLERVPAKDFGDGEIWRVMVNSSRKVKAGDEFNFAGLKVTILDDDGATRLARLDFDGEPKAILEKIADMPLPPYIKRANESLDRERYQTVFAKTSGSVAAPTAGLHFTPKVLQSLKSKGVKIAEVTLHVGPGTFLPVRTDDITGHKMHEERFTISRESCDTINAAKASGRKITAVGTTSVRVLETLAKSSATLSSQTGTTDIFIRPPFGFKIVDRLLTNFHQPESTLLILVSAFAGREFVLGAYKEAIQQRYRLFSYGDAMLIL